MSVPKTVFDNCPSGSIVMTNGKRWVYAIDKSMQSNYRGLGYAVGVMPVEPPKEVKDATVSEVKKPATKRTRKARKPNL